MKFYNFELKGYNLVILVVGFIIGIAAFCYPSEVNKQVRLGDILFPTIIIITIILCIANHYRTKLKEEKELERSTIKSSIIKPPTIICGTEGYDPDSKALILIEHSKNFKENTLVSFYYENTLGIADIIGIGRVTFIQDDKDMQTGTQIELTHIYDKYDEIAAKLRSNNKHTLKNTKIYPRVNKRDLDELYLN